MHDATREKLKQFANVGTWTSKHWADLGRFYQFTAEAYRHGDTSISFDEFSAVIKEARHENEDVIEDIFRELHSRYDIAMEIIKVFDTGNI